MIPKMKDGGRKPNEFMECATVEGVVFHDLIAEIRVGDREDNKRARLRIIVSTEFPNGADSKWIIVTAQAGAVMATANLYACMGGDEWGDSYDYRDKPSQDEAIDLARRRTAETVRKAIASRVAAGKTMEESLNCVPLGRLIWGEADFIVPR